VAKKKVTAHQVMCEGLLPVLEQAERQAKDANELRRAGLEIVPHKRKGMYSLQLNKTLWLRDVAVAEELVAQVHNVFARTAKTIELRIRESVGREVAEDLAVVVDAPMESSQSNS
jgi:predicted nuclease with RNAse H fold